MNLPRKLEKLRYKKVRMLRKYNTRLGTLLMDWEKKREKMNHKEEEKKKDDP